jgi:hypothetical protein
MYKKSLLINTCINRTSVYYEHKVGSRRFYFRQVSMYLLNELSVSLYTRIFIVHCIFNGVCNLTNPEYTVIFFKHRISLSQCFNTLNKFHLCRLYHHFIRDCRGHDRMIVGFMGGSILDRSQCTCLMNCRKHFLCLTKIECKKM